MADWNKIKSEYIGTNISYRKLAEKYKVAPNTLYRRMQREGWVQSKHESDIRCMEQIVKKAATSKVMDIDRVQSVADALLERIEEGIADGSLTGSSKDLKAIASSLKDIKDIKGIKNDLDAQEQLARIAKLKHDAQDQEKTDNSIRIVIANELEEYCE